MTNRKIQRLTFDCLQYYLKKFRPLKFFHPVDKDYEYTSVNERDRYEGPWRRLNPLVSPVRFHDIGAPSWIEQQRVLRAFWRVRLFFELKDAIAISCITWPKKDISAIWQMKLEDLNDVPTRFRDDEWTARLLGQTEAEHDSELYVHQQVTLLEAELIQSVVDYLGEGRKLMRESTFLKLKSDWATSPSPRNSKEWDWEDMCEPHISPMWLFFYNMSGGSGMHLAEPNTPLQHVSFAPFRRLGVAIWCRSLLSKYEFLASVPQLEAYRSMLSACSTAWRSVLTPSERIEANKENES